MYMLCTRNILAYIHTIYTLHYTLFIRRADTKNLLNYFSDKFAGLIRQVVLIQKYLQKFYDHCTIIVAKCRSGGTGRRTGFKIQRWQHREGSTPSFGTISNSNLDVMNLCSWHLLFRAKAKEGYGQKRQ